MKKKIIIFYPYINAFGGIERLIIELSKNLSINLVCYYDKINITKYNKNLKKIELKPSSYLQKIIYLKKYFKSTNMICYPLMWGYKASFFAFLSRIKNYGVFIDDPPSLLSNYRDKINNNPLNFIKSKIAKKIEYYSIQNAKFRLTQTKRNSLELSKNFNCNFEYFYPGLAFNINKKLIKSDKEINILSISRLEKNKKVKWIIQCLKDLKAENPNLYKKIKINIAGEGAEKESLKKFSYNSKISEKINFLGFVSDKQKNILLKKNHIFLVPAKQGYGLPVLEALNYMNKIVVNKESRISEVLSENNEIKIANNNYLSFYNKFKLILKESNSFDLNIIKKLPKSVDWVKFIENKCKWKN